MHKTRVDSLENPLEKGMAAHSSILAWGNPMDRGAWQATIHGGEGQRVGHDWATNTHTRDSSTWHLSWAFKEFYDLGYKCKRFLKCKDWRTIEIVLWQFPLLAKTFLGSRERFIGILKTVTVRGENAAEPAQMRQEKAWALTWIWMAHLSQPLPSLEWDVLSGSPLRSPGSVSPWRTKMSITHYLMLSRT